jgi:hypothetical protein
MVSRASGLKILGSRSTNSRGARQLDGGGEGSGAHSQALRQEWFAASGESLRSRAPTGSRPASLVSSGRHANPNARNAVCGVPDDLTVENARSPILPGMLDREASWRSGSRADEVRAATLGRAGSRASSPSRSVEIRANPGPHDKAPRSAPRRSRRISASRSRNRSATAARSASAADLSLLPQHPRRSDTRARFRTTSVARPPLRSASDVGSGTVAGGGSGGTGVAAPLEKPDAK